MKTRKILVILIILSIKISVFLSTEQIIEQKVMKKKFGGTFEDEEGMFEIAS
jgi:hypothetical protein